MHGVTRTQNSFKMNVFRVKISKIFPARPNHGGPRGAELKPLFAGSYYTLTVDRACTRVTVSVTVTEQLEHNHKTVSISPIRFVSSLTFVTLKSTDLKFSHYRIAAHVSSTVGTH